MKADTTCSVALSFDLNRDDKTIRLWSMPSGAPIATVSVPSTTWDIAVSQRHLAVAGPQTVRIFDVGTSALLHTVNKDTYGRVGPVGLYFSPDGKQLFIVPELLRMSRAEDKGRLFDVETGAELPTPTILLPPLTMERGVVTPDCPVPKQQTFSH